MNPRRLTPWLLAAGLTAAGCMRPAEERARLDEQVGRAEVEGVSFQVAEGLAVVRAVEPGALDLWAQAPSLAVSVAVEGGSEHDWRVTVRNCMPRSEMTAEGVDGRTLQVELLEHPIPTVKTWLVRLPETGAASLNISPPDGQVEEPWRFAVLSDVQKGMDRVQDLFDIIDADASVRFVVSAGDLADEGRRAELERFQQELRALRVPFFTTIGNHDAGLGDARAWHELFGRYSFHFRFKGVAFSLADSASATIDPKVYRWLDSWLEAGRGGQHVFVTHYPPLDPVGVLNRGFSSRKEAAKLLGRLAEGGVDLCLYGHVHSYHAFSNAGIPAYVSGGGGAIAEHMEGIGRHFLLVDADPERGIDQVQVVRVGY